MFNVSEVPKTRWVNLKFDVAGDYDEKVTNTFDLEVFVKSQKELHEIRKKAIEDIEKQIAEGKDIPPNEAVHLVIAKSLIHDWKGIIMNHGDGTKSELPFNDANWDIVISCIEAQAAIIKAISAVSKREDLITKN